MKPARLALAIILTATLAACSGEPDPGPAATATTPMPSGAEASPSASTPEGEGPAPMPVEPSIVETMNTDKEWDDWGVDDALPSPGPEQSLVQLIRMDFTDPEAINAHIRLGLPVGLLEAPEGEEITFCNEGDADTAVIGFGDHWQVDRTERDGYVVCDTVGTFGLDEWGDDALLAKPTLEDGTWTVDFERSFIPEQTVALYRFRMEFGGPVTEASDGGAIDGNAVTWNGPSEIRAVAESGN
jgi:hypothetical protein